ncbi:MULTISPECIES: DUF3748 domain-containing protein [Emticicia]|uniref:DUF3748 domain-containing protein n=1 Tax=Emticicia TaxID=312278 RepID=UPI0007D8A4CD|nr:MULTISPECIES: DUF3748 domain-containing protein [Emticicia]
MKSYFSLIFLLLTSCKTMRFLPEIQLTNDLSYHHDLDNNDNFSPDNQWLVYDTRTDEGGIAASAKIEKVNVKTGDKKVVYEIKNNQFFGPGVGAASYSPVANQVIFIHGLQNVTEQNPYQQWRRTGVMIDETKGENPIYIDARDINTPFTKGALRGGTHRHEFSGDGNWIGFTYNDAIMKSLEDATGQKQNLRTIGVSKKGKSVNISEKNNGENLSGEWFSALVVRVVPNPKNGSDEISHAAGDSWVGKNGYLKPDGTRQMARAFIGTVKTENGENVDEVFVVDIPKNIEIDSEFGALEGTETQLPQPPKGASQRRLTFTAKNSHAGCTGIVRSNFEGSLLAFLAKDEKNIKQIFTISPNGGSPQQITFHESDVEGSIRWHPSGKSIFYIWNSSICEIAINDLDFDKRLKIISKPSKPSPTNLVISHDGKMIAFNRLLENVANSIKSKQIFLIKLD